MGDFPLFAEPSAIVFSCKGVWGEYLCFYFLNNGTIHPVTISAREVIRGCFFSCGVGDNYENFPVDSGYFSLENPCG